MKRFSIHLLVQFGAPRRIDNEVVKRFVVHRDLWERAEDDVSPEVSSLVVKEQQAIEPLATHPVD